MSSSAISVKELKDLFNTRIDSAFPGPFKGNDSHILVKYVVQGIFEGTPDEKGLTRKEAQGCAQGFVVLIGALSKGDRSGPHLMPHAAESVAKIGQQIIQEIGARITDPAPSSPSRNYTFPALLLGAAIGYGAFGILPTLVGGVALASIGGLYQCCKNRRPATLPQIFRETLEEAKRLPQAKAEFILPSGEFSEAGPRYQTKIEILNQSTFKTATDLISQGYNPLVLDMANAYDVGGAPDKANAQEETLCRQSTLYPALQQISKGQSKYDQETSDGFYQGGGIYVKNAYFIRDERYAFIRPVPVSFFVSAAYNCNKGADVPNDSQIYIDGTMEKMRTMFRVARTNGHDSLVLSAFGCGVFKNDPRVIAILYKQVLNEPEFKGAFKKISFGIVDTAGSKNGRIFKDILGQ